jgi:hypothetical protein
MAIVQQHLLYMDIPCLSNAATDDYWWAALGKTGENSTRGGGIGFDSSGNLYGMGQTKDQAGGHLNPYTYEGYVWKINSSGSHQWHRVLGESGRRNSNYDSTFFFTGEVNSSGDVYASGQIHEYNVGTNDGPYWCITGKWNSSGTLQWQRVLKGNGAGGTGEHSGVNGSGLDSSGNYYIFGDLWVDRDRALIAKYNSSGTLQWYRLLDGGSGTYTRWECGHVHSNGDIYVGGISNSHSYGNTTGYPLLAKYNSSGTLQWQRYLRGVDGGNIGARFHGMDVDSDGNVYCVSGLGVGKWNSSGQSQWQRQVNGGGGFWDCCVDTCGNVYCLDFREDLIDGDSSNDLLIAKLDTNGNGVWTRAFGNDVKSDFNTWGSMTINDEHTLCISASTQAVYTGTSSTNSLMIKLPNDGSLTGTYGDLKYMSVSMNVSTPTMQITYPSLTDGSSGATSVNSSYPESASDNNYTKVDIN